MKNNTYEKYSQIIENICRENNIDITFLSDKYVMVLKKDNKIRYITGYKFDLNNQGLASVADDKYAMYELLKHHNFNITEYKLIFRRTNFDVCKQYFLNNNKHIVVKQTDGTCGNYVYQIFDEITLEKIINKLLEFNSTITLSPFYDIKNEYRCIVVNKKIKYSYKKIKPIITGDGIHTIKELLELFNPYFFNKSNAFFNKNYDINEVLQKDKTIEYGWMFNLSKGAKIGEIVKERQIFVNELAEKIANTLDISLASIDIIEDQNGNFMVIEINSGIMMNNLIKQLPDGADIAKEIYTEAILSMFKK